MKTNLVHYLSDAISRVDTGGVSSPSGSWVAGIFGKAANLFEKEVRSYVTGLLRACDLSYPADLGDAVKGFPPYKRLTLGQLIAVIRDVGKRNYQCAAQYIPGGWQPASFLDALQEVNEAWVNSKHGEEITVEILVKRMKTMLTLAKLLIDIKERCKT